MDVMKMNTLMFASGNGTLLNCTPSVKVGMRHDVYKSKIRGTISSPSQISTVGLVMQKMLESDESSFSYAKLSDGGIYAEFPRKGESCVCAILNGVCISSTERLLPEEVVGMFCVQTLTDKSNEEFRDMFITTVTRYNDVGNWTRNNAYILCDAFYYGTMKKKNIKEVQCNIVPKAAIDAALRSLNPSSIAELKGTTAVPPKYTTVKKTIIKKKEPDSDLNILMKECKAGKYLVNYQWDTTQEEYIQSLHSLDGYIPNEEFRSILKKIKFRTDRVLQRMQELDLTKGQDRVEAIGKDYINLTLSGKPGTGKTKLAYMLAAATGLPIYTVANSHNTDEDEYEGKTKMIDGRAVSVETDTLKCAEHGGILLLEEINLVNAAVAMGSLGQFVEFPFVIKKFGYKPIRRHPLCIIITTMNTGTAGSKSMSQPFANRFKQSFVLNDPAKEDFIRILMSNTGAGRDICRWVYECYDRITACIEADNGMADVEGILLSLSMRSCAGAIENIQEGMEPRAAIVNSIIGKIAEQDHEVAESCKKVLSGMRDPDFDLIEE